MRGFRYQEIDHSFPRAGLHSADATASNGSGPTLIRPVRLKSQKRHAGREKYSKYTTHR